MMIKKIHKKETKQDRCDYKPVNQDMFLGVLDEEVFGK